MQGAVIIVRFVLNFPCGFSTNSVPSVNTPALLCVVSFSLTKCLLGSQPQNTQQICGG
jgi:hypothetical protein